ncbi:serine hydrolase domain-containing protein [Paenibacillus sp. 1001270B_150601_E10]|uniref:serine hydrolase domain-containing protein n=1 Tax=Paenibacillus sp. 1001270B_150601_E10 TaxID=2787079 RepID=UPI00189E23F8|nr:serine hydrolase [Paenibacillus sp. 1001270B_150601_E10]
MVQGKHVITEWERIAPSDAGMDAKRLEALTAKIETDYSNTNGIVIVRKGSIVYEQYFNGYSKDDRHHVASVTKSFLSALIGIAIEEGYIKGVEQKVIHLFPEYEWDDSNGLKQEITIRHLLTMTAPYAFEDWNEPLDIMCMQKDWVRYALDVLGDNGPIGAFKYSTAGSHLLSAILTRTTGQSARAFANERLCQRIGMNIIPDPEMTSYEFDDLFGGRVRGWVHDPYNYSTGGFGLTLSPRDMARFGLLYIRNGRWNEQKVIPQAWIQESTAMNANQYGYMWWLREEHNELIYSAIGDGGNIICCIPNKDLVIASASAFMFHPKDRWSLIKDEILPAVIKSL